VSANQPDPTLQETLRRYRNQQARNVAALRRLGFRRCVFRDFIQTAICRRTPVLAWFRLVGSLVGGDRYEVASPDEAALPDLRTERSEPSVPRV
jgi:hypothetical protein